MLAWSGRVFVLLYILSGPLNGESSSQITTVSVLLGDQRSKSKCNFAASEGNVLVVVPTRNGCVSFFFSNSNTKYASQVPHDNGQTPTSQHESLDVMPFGFSYFFSCTDKRPEADDTLKQTNKKASIANAFVNKRFIPNGSRFRNYKINQRVPAPFFFGCRTSTLSANLQFIDFFYVKAKTHLSG